MGQAPIRRPRRRARRSSVRRRWLSGNVTFHSPALSMSSPKDHPAEYCSLFSISSTAPASTFEQAGCCGRRQAGPPRRKCEYPRGRMLPWMRASQCRERSGRGAITSCVMARRSELAAPGACIFERSRCGIEKERRQPTVIPQRHFSKTQSIAKSSHVSTTRNSVASNDQVVTSALATFTSLATQITSSGLWAIQSTDADQILSSQAPEHLTNQRCRSRSAHSAISSLRLDVRAAQLQCYRQALAAIYCFSWRLSSSGQSDDDI